MEKRPWGKLERFHFYIFSTRKHGDRFPMHKDICKLYAYAVYSILLLSNSAPEKNTSCQQNLSGPKRGRFCSCRADSLRWQNLRGLRTLSFLAFSTDGFGSNPCKNSRCWIGRFRSMDAGPKPAQDQLKPPQTSNLASKPTQPVNAFFYKANINKRYNAQMQLLVDIRKESITVGQF